MTVLLVLLLAIFLLLILRLFVVYRIFGVKERFETSDLDPTFIKEYTNFSNFYNQFMTNWQNAIITSIVADTPQQPLENSSNTNPSTPPQPTLQAQNTYIVNLSKTLGQTLPQITGPLPTQIDSTGLQSLLQTLPQDSTPFMNALAWMNSQLEKSQANLGTALQGQTFEPFDDMCQNFSQCLANNPQFAQQVAQQIAQAQQQAATSNTQQLEQQISTILQKFNTDQSLQTAQQTNNQLVQTSQNIQNQAQSGELFKQINVPDKETTYVLPPGSDALSQLKEQNPQKYNDYKNNYSQWFNIKQLIDQINSAL